MTGDRLPDLLGPGLRLVFCGTAASTVSARLGAYYARPGNRFWAILAEAGFTPALLRPDQFRDLLPLGIGLTDLAKRAAGVDSSLRPEDFDIERFRTAIDMCQPQAVAFTSATAARIFLGRGDVSFGEAPPPPGFPRLFVLPSTSGANGHWARQRHHWHEAARRLGFARA